MKIIRILIVLLPLFSLLSGQTQPVYQGRGDITGTNNNFPDAVTAVNPESYVLGPGDRLFVSLRGVMDKNFEIQINPEGYGFIPRIGLIELSGKKISEAKNTIRQSLEMMYRDVEMDVALASVRIIRTDLIGYVANPSSYNVPATTRLSDLVQKAGGLPADADIRNIEIIGENGISNRYDLLKFYRLGDTEANPVLNGGDIIKIKKTTGYVTVSGETLYPGVYEYTPGETSSGLLQLAGGALENARKDSIELIRFGEDKLTLYSKYYRLDQLTDGGIPLEKGDKIIVRGIPDYMMDRMAVIEGKVVYPGAYKIQKGETDLYSLIMDEAGGFLPEASLNDAYITRNLGMDTLDPEFERLKVMDRENMTEDEYDYFKAKSRERKGRMVIDFNKLFVEKDMSENIILKRGDRIVVPEAKDFVTIVGQVVHPGNILYNLNMKTEDYIELAGGYSWRAVKSDVRIIKSSTGEWIEAEDVESIKPGDIIWVPEEPPAPKFWDIFIDSLTIFGQLAAIVASVTAVIIATR